jgi:hypothetical protein
MAEFYAFFRKGQVTKKTSTRKGRKVLQSNTGWVFFANFAAFLCVLCGLSSFWPA